MSEYVPSKIKTAFLCDRMGPYHYARLNAAHRLTDITAVEFSALDHTNSWEPFDNQGRCPRISLFEDKPITMQPRQRVINRVRAVMGELKPQVVVVSGWDAPASLCALQWCLESETPSVLLSESQQHDEQRVWWKEAIKSRIVRLNNSGFVGGSPHKAYLNRLGMPEEQIFTGCDIVDNEYFMVGSDAARQNAVALKKQYDLPERYFLASSRFIQKKNLSRLLQAYSQYLKNATNNPWKLVLLGDGELKEQLLNQRAELGLSDMVLMPGFAQYDDLPVYYGLAGAFVLASTSEQWGLVVNEAVASALPVVVSARCGSATSLVKDGHNGFTFDPYDVDALSRHLTHVASDNCPRDTMGRAGRNILSGCSPEVFAENLKSAIEAALRRPGRNYSLMSKLVLTALMRK